MKYLLDTNTISYFILGDQAVVRRLTQSTPADLAVSAVTVMESEYGLALNARRARQLRPLLDALVASMTIVAFGSSEARAAGALRAALRRRGRPIGPYDVQIAGTALAHGLTLVTSNTGEFARVQGLLLEDWRKP